MPQDIINTVVVARESSGCLPPNVARPLSPGSGANNLHPAGTEGNLLAPGSGIPAQRPTFQSTPASTSSPNVLGGGASAPGTGVADDSPEDGGNLLAGDGPVRVARAQVSLTTVAGGLLMPGGAPANVVQNTIVAQILGVGYPQNVSGGAH